MKPKHIIISIFCLIVYILLVYLLYLKFYQPIINPERLNQQTINFNQTNSGIYFQSNENYYLASADTTANRLFVSDKIDITNEIDNLNILPETLNAMKTISTSNGNFSLKTEQLNSKNAINIYFTDTITGQTTRITNVAYPSIVFDFNFNQNSKKIVFSILNKDTDSSEISICNIDGSNLLQLTNDTISYFPVFSPNGNTIAYWRKNLGIYIINTDKTNFKKILNFGAKIDQIFVWR
jgi:hypothetical protein